MKKEKEDLKRILSGQYRGGRKRKLEAEEDDDKDELLKRKILRQEEIL